ncbi:MAG: hypothetical protein ACO1OF_01610, partial [Adhaeribacter sp.]
IIDHRTTKTVVNPHESLSTIIDNVPTKTDVNPDGTHSTNVDYGPSSTPENSDELRLIKKISVVSFIITSFGALLGTILVFSN